MKFCRPASLTAAGKTAWSLASGRQAHSNSNPGDSNRVGASVPIDMGYIVSLLDRPAEMPRPTTSLTPKKWPAISVKTEMLTRTGKRALLDDKNYRESGVSASKPKDDPVNWYDWPPVNFDEDVLPSTGLPTECASLDEVLRDELSSLFGEYSNERSFQELGSIRKMWRRLRIEKPTSLSRLSDAPFSQLNCYPHFLEIEFPGSVKDKTLSTILAHAFGYDLKERSNVTAAVPAEVSKQKTPIIGEEQEKLDGTASRGIPSKIFAATGADLHLIEYGMLQRLARLYRLPVDDVSRSALERSLCKFFSKYAESSPTSIQLTCILENGIAACGKYRAFTKGSRTRRCDSESFTEEVEPSAVKSKGSCKDWTADDDQLLLLQVEKVSRARQQMALALYQYLCAYDADENLGSKDQHAAHTKVHPPKDVLENAIVMGEAVNLWEVVAKCFPQGDHSAKVCKKRWQILQRLQCLDS